MHRASLHQPGEPQCRNSATPTTSLIWEPETAPSRRRRVPPQFVLPLTVLVLVFAAGAFVAALFGASVLRTPPQGSDELLASGIFFSDSLYAFSLTASASFSSGVFEVSSGIKLMLGVCAWADGPVSKAIIAARQRTLIGY